uniref:BURP domain-containing protein 9-like n=1 Tax=Fragaria vesca subsp. vesca TaxID=101020 RepID=UPI0005CA36F9|nr:PREDICTED: BURP domain-containing protein 9-like [Fragaria vesca subsp. vesca]
MSGWKISVKSIQVAAGVSEESQIGLRTVVPFSRNQQIYILSNTVDVPIPALCGSTVNTSYSHLPSPTFWIDIQIPTKRGQIVKPTRFRCRDANGARNVFKQEGKEQNAPYITSYGTKEGTQEVEAPYITQYGSKEGNKVDEVEAPYVTGYISAQGNPKETETPYIAQGRKGRKEVEAPYITGYISAEGAKRSETVEIPYITQYGDKEASYITQDGTKEGTLESTDVEAPYITGYISAQGTKKVEAPYLTGYNSAQGTKGKKEVEAPYITGYISAQDTKEVEAPYLAGYNSAQGTKGKREVEAPYITGYISAQGTKNVEAPYLVGYNSAQGTKSKKEVEAPYITGYISAHGAKNCGHQKHVHPPSQNGAKESPMEHQHHDHAHSSSPMDHTEALKQGLFTFEDFYKGNALPLNFPKQEHSRFLPKETADSIPFSTSQLPHLLQLFSTPRDSREAKHMAWTLDQCELKPIKGETKFCATSLESMTEFIQKIIGSGISFNILSTTLPETSTSITQKYTILEEPKQVIASKMVFCHPVPYPYAVFFCHHFEKDTKFFKVSLRGENGDKIEAVAVCHMDTSDWDPNHGLFRLLGIKAGASSPVCHFFPANHLVWIPSSPTTTIF